MDARYLCVALVTSALASVAANHRTPNFIINAPTPEIAQQVGTAAEHFRRELAIEWTGKELPRWYSPCSVHVKVGQVGAGGATTFSFDRGEVFGWNMTIQGPLDRILDSVLPHEISHTIFACYFRRPLPRWADEGAATLAEHDSEKQRQVLTVRQILGTTKRIPLRNLVAMKEYPSEMRDVLTLYAEGYSLAELLVQEGGKSRYLAFLADAETIGWDRAIKKHYGYAGVDALEKEWHSWVYAGSPDRKNPSGIEFVSAQPKKPAPTKPAAASEVVVRGQTPEEDPFLKETTVAMATVPPPGIKRKSDLSAPAPRRAATASAAPRQQPAVPAVVQTAAAETPRPAARPLPKKALRVEQAESLPVEQEFAQQESDELAEEEFEPSMEDVPLLRDLNRGWVTVAAASQPAAPTTRPAPPRATTDRAPVAQKPAKAVRPAAAPYQAKPSAPRTATKRNPWSEFPQ